MTKTAIIYGDALYELFKDEGEKNRTGRVLGEMEQIQQLLDENPDYLRLLSTASLSKEERCRLLDEALRGRVEPYLLNFLKILCEQGHLRELGGCAREFRLRYNEDQGILAVTAVTAMPLEQALQEKLIKKLKQTTGKQIDLHCKVDPRVLGGIRLEMDGKQLDGTVKNSFDQLRRQLNDTVL